MTAEEWEDVLAVFRDEQGDGIAEVLMKITWDSDLRRERIAIAMMQALIGLPSRGEEDEYDPAGTAKVAVAYAKALEAELKGDL